MKIDLAYKALNVIGHCPEGCGRTLFLGKGGHVTCSWELCPNPSAADELLNNPGLLRFTEEALRERNRRLKQIAWLARGEVVLPEAEMTTLETERRG